MFESARIIADNILKHQQQAIKQTHSACSDSARELRRCAVHAVSYGHGCRLMYLQQNLKLGSSGSAMAKKEKTLRRFGVRR